MSQISITLPDGSQRQYEAGVTGADWTELDAAFSANRDPLTGFEPGDEYRPLFDKILATTPAPVGLGPAR